MLLIAILVLFVVLFKIGNFIYDLYIDDKYEQNINTCTYEDYKLAEKLAR